MQLTVYFGQLICDGLVLEAAEVPMQFHKMSTHIICHVLHTAAFGKY